MFPAWPGCTASLADFLLSLQAPGQQAPPDLYLYLYPDPFHVHELGALALQQRLGLDHQHFSSIGKVCPHWLTLTVHLKIKIQNTLTWSKTSNFIPKQKSIIHIIQNSNNDSVIHDSRFMILFSGYFSLIYWTVPMINNGQVKWSPSSIWSNWIPLPLMKPACNRACLATAAQMNCVAVASNLHCLWQRPLSVSQWNGQSKSSQSQSSKFQSPKSWVESSPNTIPTSTDSNANDMTVQNT